MRRKVVNTAAWHGNLVITADNAKHKILKPKLGFYFLVCRFVLSSQEKDASRVPLSRDTNKMV
jgi:hypothetical protein